MMGVNDHIVLKKKLFNTFFLQENYTNKDAIFQIYDTAWNDYTDVGDHDYKMND